MPRRSRRPFAPMTDPDSTGDFGRQLLRSDLEGATLRVAVAGFAALWRGHPVEPTALLPGRGEEGATAVAALAERGRAQLDGRGRLVGVHGLTLGVSRHSFVHHGVARHTWCAFDSVGIPAALRIDAVAHTDCPTCGSALSVNVQDAVARPSSLVLWLPAPNDESHLIDTFCAVADLFCSRAHLEQRIDVGSSLGRVVSVAEACEIGSDVWADVAGVDIKGSDRNGGIGCG